MRKVQRRLRDNQNLRCNWVLINEIYPWMYLACHEERQTWQKGSEKIHNDGLAAWSPAHWKYIDQTLRAARHNLMRGIATIEKSTRSRLLEWELCWADKSWQIPQTDPTCSQSMCNGEQSISTRFVIGLDWLRACKFVPNAKIFFFSITITIGQME